MRKVPEATPSPDESLVLDLLQRFFAAVSFPEGGTPAYEELPDLFSPEGRLIRASGPVPDDRRVGDFVEQRRQVLAAGELSSFQEAETSGETHVFGSVAHRLSVYAKAGVGPAGAFSARGVISTQFVRGPGGWRISSMAWDDERPGLSLPSARP